MKLVVLQTDVVKNVISRYVSYMVFHYLSAPHLFVHYRPNGKQNGGFLIAVFNLSRVYH